MEMQTRNLSAKFETREENDDLYIEAYWAVYNSPYEIAPGAIETIAPGAFKNALGGDIRALINHDTTLVIGRTTAGTFELHDDEHGLFGRVRINRDDSDAMNAYARVKRGDVSQCSIGFDIVKQDTEIRDDGTVHWTIEEVVLYECSLCTFPAYEETSAHARAKEREELLKAKKDAWRAKMLSRLKGEANA